MKRQQPKDLKGQVTNLHSSTAADSFLFFYMPDAKHGEFCQWYPSAFTVSRSQISLLVGHAIDHATDHTFDNNLENALDNAIDSAHDSTMDSTTDSATNDTKSSITFNCAEQFMMYCKAGRFHDRETQRKVLATDSPKEQKRLGRLTAKFTHASWDKVKSDVVVAGNVAKFRQNPYLKRKLLATGRSLLVEAASRDRVWGIGYTAKHAISHQKHWGENRLGKALMVVREQLREEEEVLATTVT